MSGLNLLQLCRPQRRTLAPQFLDALGRHVGDGSNASNHDELNGDRNEGFALHILPFIVVSLYDMFFMRKTKVHVLNSGLLY